MTMTKKNAMTYAVMLFCTMGFTVLEIVDIYAIRAIGKIVLGILIPCIFAYMNKEVVLKRFLKFKKEGMKLSVILAMLTVAIVLIYFFATKNIIDYSGMLDSVMELSNGSLVNLLLIDFHIIFINAFVEEFFFRGFVYHNLKNSKWAISISSLLFAAYHTFMLFGWFEPIIGIASLLALVVVGCIFIKINQKSESIYPSWIIHASANLALNICGLILVLQSGVMNV